MVNVPKSRNTYCAKCNKHGKFKVPIDPTCAKCRLTCVQVTQYKKSAESKQAQGRRR